MCACQIINKATILQVLFSQRSLTLRNVSKHPRQSLQPLVVLKFNQPKKAMNVRLNHEKNDCFLYPDAKTKVVFKLKHKLAMV